MQPERNEVIEAIFDLPEEVIREPRLRAQYSAITDQLRFRLADVGMGTNMEALMLAERSAFLYIVCKQKEMRINGIGYQGREQMSLGKLWMEFHRDLIAMIRSAPKTQNDQWDRMQEIIYEVVAAQQPTVQRKLAKDFSSAFEREKIKK